MSLKKKVLIVIAVILAVFLCITGCVFFILGSMSNGAVPIISGEYDIDYAEPEVSPAGSGNADTEDDVQDIGEEAAIYKAEPLSEDVINILLIGQDAREDEISRGRSDTMIILSYNSKEREASLVSLMRDTLLPIDGYGWSRLNHAFSWGGAGLCINTINANFGLDIQNYVIVDFDGLTGLVDEIGGIDVEITQEEADMYNTYLDWDNVSAGVVHMTGEMALSHARNRTLGNDFARTDRQRAVLIAFYEKLLSSVSPSTVSSLIDFSMTQVETNLTATEILSFAADVFTGDEIEVNTGRVPADGTWTDAVYNGMSILKINIDKNSDYLHSLIYSDEQT